ncbi:MAG: hypothetical protein L0229_03575 [Blastocatellia bacterium]|nr:hypothetical protein [Blastocatellia bacterium]
MEQTTLTIRIPKNVETILEERARADGKDVQTFVEEMVKTQLLRPTLDEILAPLRKDFAESGMTEDESDALVESERQAMWEEKYGKRK